MICFPNACDLRPTPSRVRETLFNWLGQTLYGKSCLDLFAGSGALGFEAASRGAERVVMVEKNTTVFRALQHNISKLLCTNVFAYCQDGLEFPTRDLHRYDVIFLDPPFQGDYLSKLLQILPQCLNKNGRVYVESGSALEPMVAWKLLKSGRAGQVHYQLLGLAVDD